MDTVDTVLWTGPIIVTEAGHLLLSGEIITG